MSNQEGNCLLLFAKYPEKGKVKRRLVPHLGEEKVVELYKNFMLDSLSTMNASGVEFYVCVYPPDSKASFIEWLGSDYSYLPQEGENLGERIKNGFISAFARTYNRVVTIGSDIPNLPCEFINDAFSRLTTEDMVIGPAADGGYYLIGFTRTTFLPESFEGIPWGTHTVLQETLKVVKKRSHSVHLLPEWHDIDTYDDLKNVIKKSKDTPFRHSKTFSYLATIGEVPSEDIV